MQEKRVVELIETYASELGLHISASTQPKGEISPSRECQNGVMRDQGKKGRKLSLCHKYSLPSCQFEQDVLFPFALFPSQSAVSIKVEEKRP